MIFTLGMRVRSVSDGKEGVVVNRNPVWTPDPSVVPVRMDYQEQHCVPEHDYDVYLPENLTLVAPLTPFEAEVNAYITQELRG